MINLQNHIQKLASPRVCELDIPRIFLLLDRVPSRRTATQNSHLTEAGNDGNRRYTFCTSQTLCIDVPSPTKPQFLYFVACFSPKRPKIDGR